MNTMQPTVNHIPDHGQRPGWAYRLRLWRQKMCLFFSGFFVIFDQDKFDYELTYWEKRSELAHYLGERRRKVENGERLKMDPLAHVGYMLAYSTVSPFFWWFIKPFLMLMGGISWFAIPKLDTTHSKPLLQKVNFNKGKTNAKIEGTPYGMEEAAMLCQCDGHRLFLYGNAFGGILISSALVCFLIFLLPPTIGGVFQPLTTFLMYGLFAVLILMAHFPARHGVIFDRDAQTAMLIRGWLRKPLVVPFEGIFFTSYTEDARNFSKDLIVHSQYVPAGRKKPIRLLLNTAIGSTGYSMAQVVGAVDCFMDKANTHAMPLSIKHSIEWHRKHKLTLWHMAWRPLPESELPKYTAADSLYQTELLDPKDETFKFQLTAEGRDILRKEDLLNRYLAAVWENMSLDNIDAKLKQAAEAEFGTDALEKRIREQVMSESAQSIRLVNFLNKEKTSKSTQHKLLNKLAVELSMKEKDETLSYIFDALKAINKSKEILLAHNEITYEQYKNSFKYAKPKSANELNKSNVVAFSTAKESE